MNKSSFSLLLLLLAGSLMAGGAGASQFVEDVLRIEADRLIYQNKSISIPIRREALLRVFGPPSREVYNVAGNVLIWDTLGLSCYGCQVRAAQPEEFQYMTDEEIENYRRSDYIGTLTMYARKYNPYPGHEKTAVHEPRLPFPGAIRLQGVDIDGTRSIMEFMQQRRGEQTILLPENSFSFFVRCQPQPHEITLHTIRDKYDADYLGIYSVSIRNIGHFYKKISCLEVFVTGEPPPELRPEEPVEPVVPIMPILE